MSSQRLQTGVAGERAAERRYVERGYRVLARNWRCSIGELDLVLARGETLVVCEVKARRSAAFGGGWEAVTARKRGKLRALAEAFVLATGARPRDTRFDVASVLVRADGSADVECFEDAF